MTLEDDIGARELGRDPGVLVLNDRAGNRLVCERMIRGARRELCLLSRDLHKPVFDQEPFLGGLKDLPGSLQQRMHDLLGEGKNPIQADPDALKKAMEDLQDFLDGQLTELAEKGDCPEGGG